MPQPMTMKSTTWVNLPQGFYPGTTVSAAVDAKPKPDKPDEPRIAIRFRINREQADKLKAKVKDGETQSDQISWTMNYKLGERSTLRGVVKDLVGAAYARFIDLWLNKEGPFTPDYLVGMHADLTVKHNPADDGRVFANIDGIMVDDETGAANWTILFWRLSEAWPEQAKKLLAGVPHGDRPPDPEPAVPASQPLAQTPGVDDEPF